MTQRPLNTLTVFRTGIGRNQELKLAQGEREARQRVSAVEISGLGNEAAGGHIRKLSLAFTTCRYWRGRDKSIDWAGGDNEPVARARWCFVHPASDPSKIHPLNFPLDTHTLFCCPQESRPLFQG